MNPSGNDRRDDDAASTPGASIPDAAKSAESADSPVETESIETADDEVRVTVDASGRRDVVVPLRLYKTVTVFSTLIAMVCVILGFVLLDAATLQVSVLRSLLTTVLRALGVPVAAGVLSAVLAICGLAIIAVGAGVYTLGTRFRARGMGKSQEDSGEGSNNG